MRLLRTDIQNGLVLEEYSDLADRPRYAILSHVWSAYELLYEHVVASSYDKCWEGYQKVEGCCRLALQQGYLYVWIDTCCIDKSSSAELQETINSMFDLYKGADVCYAHLADVAHSASPRELGSQFRTSKWFTRGWTLQELIAPSNVVFLTREWDTIGDKVALADVIEQTTNVDYGALCGVISVQEVSVARRMSWAAKRQTTRLEDRAYSLLGLFGINMPTIYGEGNNAFYRLQQTILTQNADHSIFAWGVDGIDSTLRGILATSPDEFEDSDNVITTPYKLFRETWGIASPVPDIQKSTVGLRIEVPVVRDPNPDAQGDRWIYVGLACKNVVSDLPSHRMGTVGLLLMRARDATDVYVRPCLTGVLDFDRMASVAGAWKVEHIHIADHYQWGGDDWAPLIPQSLCPPVFRITIMAHTLSMLREQFGYALSEDLSFVDARFPEPRDPKPLTFERQNGSAGAHGEHDLTVEVPRKTIPVLVFVPHTPNASTDSAFAIGLLLFSPTSLDIQFHRAVTVNASQSQPSLWHEPALHRYQLQDWGSEGVFWRSEALAPDLVLRLELSRINISAAACHCLFDIKLQGRTETATVEERGTSLLLSQDVKPAVGLRWVPSVAGFVPQDAFEANPHQSDEDQYFIVRCRVDSDKALDPGMLRKHCSEAFIFLLPSDASSAGSSEYARKKIASSNTPGPHRFMDLDFPEEDDDDDDCVPSEDGSDTDEDSGEDVDMDDDDNDDIVPSREDVDMDGDTFGEHQFKDISIQEDDAGKVQLDKNVSHTDVQGTVGAVPAAGPPVEESVRFQDILFTEDQEDKDDGDYVPPDNDDDEGDDDDDDDKGDDDDDDDEEEEVLVTDSVEVQGLCEDGEDAPLEKEGNVVEESHYEVLAGDASSVTWRVVEGLFSQKLVNNRAVPGGHQGELQVYIAQVVVKGVNTWAIVREGQYAFQPDEEKFFSRYSVLVHV